MVVLPTGRPMKERTAYKVVGISSPITFGVHNNSLVNLRRGLVERVFNVEKDGGLQRPPQPAADAFNVLGGFRDKLVTELPKFAPCTPEEFVASYGGDRRQKVYEEARLSLLTDPVTRMDARLTTFVKAEKINFTKKPDPAPRVIQPRSPRYNLSVGCYLKRLEKEIYKGISRVYDGEAVVMKGYNAHETAGHLRRAWEKYDQPVAVGLDASRFDQHVSRPALEWEHAVYLSCYSGHHRKELARLLSWQIANKGVGRATDGIIKYAVEGCRMSGDMNTALGNCLLMCAMVWSYCETRGVKHSLANNGDDCVVIMERRDLKRFRDGLENWFLQLGFTMEVEPAVDVFERIEFCQTQPVFDGARYVMCRNPMVCMSKDTVSFLPMSMPRVAKGWCTAVGECGMSLCGGLPVMQEYYQAMLRAGRGERIGHHPGLESGFARLAWRMDRKFSRVSYFARLSFFEAFGILPGDQIKLEQRLACITPDVTDLRRGITTLDLSFLLHTY